MQRGPTAHCGTASRAVPFSTQAALSPTAHILAQIKRSLPRGQQQGSSKTPDIQLWGLIASSRHPILQPPPYWPVPTLRMQQEPGWALIYTCLTTAAAHPPCVYPPFIALSKALPGTQGHFLPALMEENRRIICE